MKSEFAAILSNLDQNKLPLTDDGSHWASFIPKPNEIDSVVARLACVIKEGVKNAESLSDLEGLQGKIGHLEKLILKDGLKSLYNIINSRMLEFKIEESFTRLMSAGRGATAIQIDTINREMCFLVETLNAPENKLDAEDREFIQKAIAETDKKVCENDSLWLKLASRMSSLPLWYRDRLDGLNPGLAATKALEAGDWHLEPILKKNPDLAKQYKDAAGNTLLHKAGLKRLKMIPVLCEHGASFDSVNDRFQLPIDLPLKERSKATSILSNQSFLYAMLPESLKDDRVLYGALKEIATHPSDLSLEQDGAFSLDDMLRRLCQECLWVKEHPNFMSVLLCHAMHQLFPAGKVIEHLQAVQPILTNERLKNLLHEAIAAGRYDLVQYLISINTNTTEVYGTPLLCESSLGITPLEQAVGEGKFEIADLLLAHGSQFDTDSSKRILKMLSEGVSNQAARWILAHIPDQAAMTGQLKRALKNQQWGEAIHWIEHGAVGVNGDLTAITQIVESHQYYLLELLVQKKLLTPLAMRGYTQKIATADASWVREFVLRKGEEIVLLDSILTMAANTGYFSLAALIVSQGYEYDEMPNQDAIKHYAGCLAGKSNEEIDFRTQLSEKNLAHLVGDSFVKKWKGDSGKNLEGNTAYESASFLSSALKYASSKSSHDITSVLPAFESARDLSLRLQGLMFLKSKEEIADALGDLERNILIDLKKMPSDRSLLLPFGWPGHGVAIALKRHEGGEVELQMINTGEGVQHHVRGHDRARQQAVTINTYRLAEDHLEQSHLLQALLEPTVARLSLEKGRTPYMPADVYSALAPYQVGKEQVVDNPFGGWKKTQLAGTCSLRCLLVYLKSQVPESIYKDLMDTIKEDAVSLAIEQYAPQLESRPLLRKFLSIAVPHLFDTFGKRLKREEVDLESSSRRLEKLVKVSKDLETLTTLPQSHNRELSLEYPFETRTEVIYSDLLEKSAQEQFKGLHKLSGKIENKGLSDLNFVGPTLDNIKTADELVTHLKRALEFAHELKASGMDSSLYLANLLRTLGRGALSDDLENLSSVFQELSQSAVGNNKAKEGQQLLEAVAALLFELQAGCNSSRATVGPSHLLAVHMALATAYKLALSIERADSSIKAHLDYFGIFFKYFRSSKSCLTHLLLNGSLERDYELLTQTNWMKGTAQALTTHEKQYANLLCRSWSGVSTLTESSANRLFNFKEHTLGGKEANLSNLMLGEKSPELNYASAVAMGYETQRPELIRQSQQELKEKCDEAKMNLRIRYPEAPEWDAHWLYANNHLPAYFNLLRDIALVSFRSDPETGIPPPALIDQYQPKGVEHITWRKITSEQSILTPYYGKDRKLSPPAGKQIDSPALVEGLTLAPGYARTRGLWWEAISQNHSIENALTVSSRELMSIRSIIQEAGSEKNDFATGLAAFRLVDFYGENLDLLADQSHQLFFEATLFAAGHLLKSLREYPELPGELQQFFDIAVSHFQDRVKLKEGKSACVRASVSLMSQYVRFLSYCKTANQLMIKEKPIESLIEEARAKICEILTDPDYQDPKMQYYLRLVLLDSFQAFPVATLAEARQMFVCLSHINKYQLLQETPTLNKALISSACLVPVEQSEHIAALLTNLSERDTHVVLDAMVGIYGLSVSQDCGWSTKRFPICSCQLNDGQTLIEVNCLNGEIRKNGQLLESIASWAKENHLYQAIFGIQNLCVTEHEAENGAICLRSTDQYGAIEILSNQDKDDIQELRREIDGSWYSYVHSTNDHPIIPLIKGHETLTVWKSLNTPSHYLFLEPNTMEQKIRLHANGCYTLPHLDPHKSFELAAFKGGDAILAIDPDAFILQETGNKPSGEVHLQLPHILNANGEPLEFVRAVPIGQEEVRWVLKGVPHLFLSQNQTISGLRSYRQYLVLESSSGEREAILPLKSLTSLQGEDPIETTYIKVRVGENALLASTPKQKIYLAYLALTHATTPKEYQQAMGYLQEARKFERYSPEELQLLGSVFMSTRETQEHTSYAYACRLYAAWLVDDNFQRNPKSLPSSRPVDDSNVQLPLNFESSPEKWEAFWQGEYIYHKGDKDHSVKTVLNDVVKGYFERAGHLPRGMRIENLVSSRELSEWKLWSRISPAEITPAKPTTRPVFHSLNTISKLIRGKKVVTGPIPSDLLMRPSQSFQDNFRSLWDMAMSQDPSRRRLLEDAIRYVSQDENPEVRFLSLLLHAAVNQHNQDGLAPSRSRLIETTTHIMNLVGDERMKASDRKDFLKAARKYDRAVNTTKPDILPHDIPPLKAVEVLPAHPPIRLPQDLITTDKLPFISFSEDTQQFEHLFQKHLQGLREVFATAPVGNQPPTAPFFFETKDPWLKANILALNRELGQGECKNNQNPTYILKESAQNVCKQYLEPIKKQVALSEAFLEQAKDNILKLANTLPEDPLKGLQQQTLLSGGRMESLVISDCVGLFLTGDEAIYRNKTKLERSEDITRLHQAIGEYIFRHNRQQRYQAVLDDLEKLSLNGDSPRFLQELAEEANFKTAYECLEDVDSSIFMVFEYALNLAIRGHLVAGVREMTEVDPANPLRLRSKFLQRIQGGGKSLLFGPVMALFKADGYHLSVHVSPTAQYQTTIYDMAQRSQHIFGQRERTFIFDDEPAKFTPQYLSSLRDTLHETIVRREYITVTSETLRAMRCKYLKTCFQIQEMPEGADREVLIRSNAVLKEILGLFRTRAIFTFDEVHLALDPTKELNMPYGPSSPPDQQESRLISRIMRYASAARDENGQPLLDIKNSAHQTEAQRSKMKEAIVERLRSEPGWDRADIIAYINGKTEELPNSLEHSADGFQQAKLVILARQLISGKWLEERLDKYLDQDHGLQEGGHAPRVSIPFIANMKPAVGSEFSDSRVMVVNTFIGYLAKGINKDQAIQLLTYVKQRASEEKAARQPTEPALALQQTQIAQKFQEACGFGLFDLDADKPEDLSKLQEALLSGTEEAIDLLLEFVTQTELNEVKLYSNQVCSNGQNTASMSQSNLGYSGSMENANMAPINTQFLPELGTNGQTLHRLIAQKTEVALVGTKADSLFTDLIDKHSERLRFRAIIDAGAHFLGVDNEEVARLICKKLRENDSEVKGVLFFHSESGKLCFMHRNLPDEFTVLSGSTPTVISQETGLRPSELFTYYDQDHTTGVDIVQADEAFAVITVKEDTEEHEVLQGARRMRGLDKGQRVIVALSNDSAGTISSKLGKEDKNAPLAIQDILLFAYLQEIHSQKTNNMLYALQKIEDQVQQFVLDRLYSRSEDEERELFKYTCYLFSKNISQDLYREYAHKRQSLPIKDYLLAVASHLIDPLESLFSATEIDSLRKTINDNVIIEPVLSGVEKEVSISSAGGSSLIAYSRDASHIQCRLQQVDQDSNRISLEEGVKESQREVESHRFGAFTLSKEDPFSEHHFNSESFSEINERCYSSDYVEVLQLNALLQRETKIATAFGKNLGITSNASKVWRQRYDLLGAWRKRSCPVVLVRDEGNMWREAEWKAMLCSEADAIQFDHWIRNKQVSVSGRVIRILRSNGKPFSSFGERNMDILSEPQVVSLMLQAMLFAGEYRSLSRDPWVKPLEKWLNKLEPEEKVEWAQFFENHVLIGGSSADYPKSALYSFLHSNKVPSSNIIY